MFWFKIWLRKFGMLLDFGFLPAVLLLTWKKSVWYTVDHNILLHKLLLYGIWGIANDWFRSNISGPKQFISSYFRRTLVLTKYWSLYVTRICTKTAVKYLLMNTNTILFGKRILKQWLSSTVQIGDIVYEIVREILVFWILESIQYNACLFVVPLRKSCTLKCCKIVKFS